MTQFKRYRPIGTERTLTSEIRRVLGAATANRQSLAHELRRLADATETNGATTKELRRIAGLILGETRRHTSSTSDPLTRRHARSLSWATWFLVIATSLLVVSTCNLATITSEKIGGQIDATERQTAAIDCQTQAMLAAPIRANKIQALNQMIAEMPYDPKWGGDPSAGPDTTTKIHRRLKVLLNQFRSLEPTYVMDPLAFLIDVGPSTNSETWFKGVEKEVLARLASASAPVDCNDLLGRTD